jgi:hypothetical protein
MMSGHGRDLLRKWRERVEGQGDALRAIAESARFEHAGERVVSVARSIYVRLPTGARLWLRKEEFEVVEPATLDQVFRVGSVG